MLLQLPIAILPALSFIAVSDTVRKFDTVRDCSFVDRASMWACCSGDEATALRHLQEAQYAAVDRKACAAEATIGGFACCHPRGRCRGLLAPDGR
jgi:hypothetical protein